MAQQVRVDLVDDIDGVAATQTVPFSVDGVAYEIDLCDNNAARLRENLAQFIDAGRRTGGRKARSAATKTNNGTATTDREHTNAVRTWARDNGWPISDRGRIPREILAAYDTAQQESAPAVKSRSRSRRNK